MGDVTGHGLAQGLVTTAVKGALDVLSVLAKGPNRAELYNPAAIISYLERVVERVADRTKLTMTCLAAEIDFRANTLRVCNAGHTFPILIRNVGDTIEVDYLHNNQQPMLGKISNIRSDHLYVDSKYELKPGDLLLVYTDGLSEAKSLNSRVFSRFLMRSLKRADRFTSASELRDEILQMFAYYTQGSIVDDDVCFLVVQMPSLNLCRASA